MIVLGIETSCDDTGIAIVRGEGKKTPYFYILSNVVASQVATHRKYGGVVPGLAAQEHEKHLLATLKKAMRTAYPLHVGVPGTPTCSIDAIAVTKGPGLLPSLLTGITFARALAYAWKLPLIGVDHMEGHLFSNFLIEIRENHKSQITNYKQNTNSKTQIQKIRFPAIALAVSGGHTQLILVKDWLKYELLGETLDDAAGEAFDKVAKLLGLGYPGGPAIEREAAQYSKNVGGETPYIKCRGFHPLHLPRPMIHTKDFNFSFSGLKTAVLYDYQKRSAQVKKSKKYIQAMAYAAQEAINETLVTKTMRAAYEYDAKTILLAGGVAANKNLQEMMQNAVAKQLPNTKLIYPPRAAFATDNAAMIAAAGYMHLRQGEKDSWKTIDAEPNRKIADSSK